MVKRARMDDGGTPQRTGGAPRPDSDGSPKRTSSGQSAAASNEQTIAVVQHSQTEVHSGDTHLPSAEQDKEHVPSQLASSR